MKSLHFLIIFLFCLSTMYSQDFEPQQRKFLIGIDSVYLSTSMDNFKQEDFILGWHWAGPRKLTHALKMNNKDIHEDIDTNDIVEDCYLIIKPNNYSHAVDESIFNARAIQYEPTLLIDSLNPHLLVRREGDSTNPVFGFRTISINRPSDSNDVNYNRIAVQDTTPAGIILDNAWPNDRLHIYNIENKGEEIVEKFLCKHMYFTINVRRPDSQNNDDPLLKIEIPYVTGGESSSRIRFKKIPSSNTLDTTHLPNNRGIVRDLSDELLTPLPREFYITRNMIPPNSQDITISAFFIMDGDDAGNKELKQKMTPASDEIDQLGIRVTNMGNGPVMIDWCRFETPHAREFLQGKFDDSLCKNFQAKLNFYTTDEFLTHGAKAFRFNLITEAWLQNWIAERYVTKLIGSVNTNEVSLIYPDHYEYYVNPPDRWIGFSGLSRRASSPYNSKQNPHDGFYLDRALGLVNGYMGYIGGIMETDSTKSHYETYLTNNFDSRDITYFLDNPNDIEEYEKVINQFNNYGRASNQIPYETNIYKNFYAKSAGNMIFSDKFWWHQNFIHVDLTSPYDSAKKEYVPPLRFDNLRTQTWEEASLFNFIPIVYGAKGLFYDGAEPTSNMCKQYFFDGRYIDTNKRDSVYNLNDYDFLNTDIVGSDYFRLENEAYKINDRIESMDTIANYLGRPVDKIYFGRRSSRLSVLWLHDWIRAVEDTLMNLRVMDTYSKGFKIWESQHPELEYDAIGKFFDVDSIFTRQPLLNSTYEGTSAYNFHDSSLYIFTLLRDIENDPNINSKFYIGLVNRRTNPLIMKNDILNFYPTAEYHDLCDSGGIDPLRPWTQWQSATQWQSYWWKREGCRVFRIPFIGKPQDEVMQDYYWFNVRDLGNGNAELVTRDYWLEPFTDHIDTSFATRGELKLWFQPGEGKFLEIEALPIVAFDQVTGSLDFCDILNASDSYFISKTKVSEDENKCCYDLYLDGLSKHLVYGLPIILTTDKDFYGDFDYNQINELTTSSPRLKFKGLIVSDSMRVKWELSKFAGHQARVYLGRICLDQNEIFEFELNMGGVGVAYDEDGNYGSLDSCYKLIESSISCSDILDTCCSAFELTAELLDDVAEINEDSVDCCRYRFKLKINDTIPCPFNFEDILHLHFSGEYEQYPPNQTHRMDELDVIDSIDPTEGQIYVFELCIPGYAIPGYYQFPRPEIPLFIDFYFANGADSANVNFCTKSLNLKTCYEAPVDRPCDEPDIPIKLELAPIGKMSLGDECCYEVFLNFNPPNNHIGAIHMETTASNIPGNPIMESMTIEGDPGLDSNQYQPIEIPPDSTIQTNFIFCLDAGVPEKIITIYYYDLNGNLMEDCTYTDTLSCPQGQQLGGAGFMRKGDNQVNEDINLHLSAVPNPAENSLFIRCRYDQNIQNSIKLKIYNIIGDEVHSEVISSNMTIEIDVSKFQKGTYIINAVEVNSVNQNGNFNRASKIIIVK
jgi:hypothetical protein